MTQCACSGTPSKKHVYNWVGTTRQDCFLVYARGVEIAGVTWGTAQVLQHRRFEYVVVDRTVLPRHASVVRLDAAFGIRVSQTIVPRLELGSLIVYGDTQHPVRHDVVRPAVESR